VWHGRAMTKPPDSGEYERLVEHLVGQLAVNAEVRSDRIERDVQVPGRGTVNQIDVLWDFVDALGQPQRVVFEARAYGRPVEQGKLHAFRSVVDDIQDPARPVTGAMVTTVGYQSGARNIASTYGLLVLELRAPTGADLANRVRKIVVTVAAQVPIVEDVAFDAVEVYEDGLTSGIEVLGALAVVPAEGGPNSDRLDVVLCHGELGTLGELRPVHDVRRDFDPPAVLLLHGRKVALLRAVTARVGDVGAPPVTVTVAGLETIAWLLRDSLTGARAWIAEDGRVWTTDS
jgi:hypothetical protein